MDCHVFTTFRHKSEDSFSIIDLSVTHPYPTVIFYQKNFCSVIFLQIISAARQRLVYRLIKGLFFVIFISSLAVLSVLLHLTAKDVFVCLLAFMQMGWGVILVGDRLILS